MNLLKFFREPFHQLAENYTDEIRESGQIISKILSLLKEIDSKKVIETLSQCTQLSGISQKFLSEVCFCFHKWFIN